MTRYVQVAAVFSEMQNTYDKGSAPVFLSVLLCSLKVWICLSGWWIAYACVCLIPRFSSKRMGKHWAFYFHPRFTKLCVFFLHLPDPLMHMLIFSQWIQGARCAFVCSWSNGEWECVLLSLGVQLHTPAVWLSVSIQLFSKYFWNIIKG